MNEQQCLSRMIAPRQRRPIPWRGGILQIWVTRACDRACYGCTQGSNLAGKPGMITVEQFDQACASLAGYWGVVGVFGGNPAMHPEFDELCRVLARHFPREQRGLWCNNPLGKGRIMRETFDPSVSNLNVHLDREAFDEFQRDWPESRVIGMDSDSRHSPVHGSMIDLGIPEPERWERIANCDINQQWSAMIGVFRGELRAWVCEVMGAQSMLQQHLPDYPDTGLPVVEGWWRRPMQDFAAQVRHHCHRCLVPLRGRGELACATAGTEQTTAEYASIFRPKERGRAVEVVTELVQLGAPLYRTTNYIQNGALTATGESAT
jgi:hypothetical protein